MAAAHEAPEWPHRLHSEHSEQPAAKDDAGEPGVTTTLDRERGRGRRALKSSVRVSTQINLNKGDKTYNYKDCSDFFRLNEIKTFLG